MLVASTGFYTADQGFFWRGEGLTPHNLSLERRARLKRRVGHKSKAGELTTRVAGGG